MKSVIRSDCVRSRQSWTIMNETVRCACSRIHRAQDSLKIQIVDNFNYLPVARNILKRKKQMWECVPGS
jgi:hypothetical protein